MNEFEDAEHIPYTHFFDVCNGMGLDDVVSTVESRVFPNANKNCWVYFFAYPSDSCEVARFLRAEHKMDCTSPDEVGISVHTFKNRVTSTRSTYVYSAPGGVPCATLVQEFDSIICTRDAFVKQMQEIERKLGQ
jgi:hypothetical protein